jgi:hypothetical protein
MPPGAYRGNSTLTGQTHAAAARRRGLHTTVDLILIRLVRSAMATDWAPAAAVPDLLEAAGGNLRVLRDVRTRVLRTLVQRPTEIGSRALVTSSLALAEVMRETSRTSRN